MWNKSDWNCSIAGSADSAKWESQLRRVTHTPLIKVIVASVVLAVSSHVALAQAQGFDLPLLQVQSQPGGGQTLSLSLQTLILMTALTLLPSLLLVTTGFTRIIITLSILRTAMGTQATPPNQVLVGLALFMTLFVMTPTIKQINETAFQPYTAGTITIEEAAFRGAGVMKGFMLRHTRESDLLLMADMQGDGKYANAEAVPLQVAVPAFIMSELRTAFTIGFLLFLPFLVIDIVVSSILMALGMMMLSPSLVSLPFKLLLFVVVDGWSATVTALVESFLRS
jgi:flagellar biosynthetic protein FliP